MFGAQCDIALIILHILWHLLKPVHLYLPSRRPKGTERHSEGGITRHIHININIPGGSKMHIVSEKQKNYPDQSSNIPAGILK